MIKLQIEDSLEKFDLISNDSALNKLMYDLAKKILFHRSGSLFEDMYWIDYEAQMNAIKEIQKNFDIMFKEVVAL